MDRLKLLWLAPQVSFRGKGIMTAWGEEMERRGWELTQDLDKADCVVFGSDSQLKPELIGKKPSIAYFWGWLPDRLLDQGFREFAERQLQMMAGCTRILVPSYMTLAQLCDFGLQGSMCMPGVDSRTLDMAHPGGRLKRVIFVSRLEHHKNLGMLIQALGIMSPSPSLVVIGPGDPTPYKQMAAAYGVPVTFDEPDDQTKALLIASSAALVHPSVYEGFGLPPLEALYLGTPVIVFDTPQMRWLLQEDALFFSSVPGLAGTIQDILVQPFDALQRARHGQARVKKALTLEAACPALEAHIHQVIKEHLGREIREKPQDAGRIYNLEHRRNWQYAANRFDPTWERHWRAQRYIELLRECNAKLILDVGCGAVYPTIFARAGFHVVALDISVEALDQVKTIAAKWGVSDQIKTVQGEAEDLSILDAYFIPQGLVVPPSEGQDQFDAVVQGEIWEHVPDTRKVIEEGLKVLKPGGYLIATTPIGRQHWDPMHMGPVGGGWDDATIRELLKPWENMIHRLDMIAEEGTDPSCYLVVLKKPGKEMANG